MRIFPLISKNINAQQSHFRFLNQQCNALIQYQDQFNPEYKILNDQYIYYTYEELVEKKIIKPVKQNDHSAIVVLVENLKYGEGLINNFTTNYVYVYFGNPSDWDDRDEIPESWLPDEATDLIFADLYMREPEGKDNCIFQYWAMANDAPLSLFEDSNTEILEFQKTCSLESTYPKLTIISFNNPKDDTATFNVVETQQAPKLYLLPSSYYIVSQYNLETPVDKNENEEAITNHSNKKDYLITRLARGGGYYTFFYFWDDEEQQTYAKATYVPEATDELGLTYLIDADPRQKRFIAVGAYDQYNGVKSASYPSFILDENNEIVIQITTPANGLWTGNNLINHEFLLSQVTNDKTHYETLFLDDTRERTSVNLHSTAAPAYKVEISQELPFIPLYNIW